MRKLKIPDLPSDYLYQYLILMETIFLSSFCSCTQQTANICFIARDPDSQRRQQKAQLVQTNHWKYYHCSKQMKNFSYLLSPPSNFKVFSKFCKAETQSSMSKSKHCDWHMRKLILKHQLWPWDCKLGEIVKHLTRLPTDCLQAISSVVSLW